MTLYLLLDVAAAYILDLILGDPYWLPHPVRFIGWLIKRTEKVLRKRATGSTKEKVAGFILALFVVSLTFFIVFIILKAAYAISVWLFHIVNVYFIYSSLAAKCLGNEALKVFDAVKDGDISQSRKRLAMLVGRETECLGREDIIRGVVETTAENTVDGIISPLFYAIVGSFFGMGAPVAYAFKAVSTLDSMVGYKNDRYINMGMVSAKLDDAVNFITARITGVLIPFAALLCGMSFRKSFSIMLRDRRNHKSPNCAYPEAAVAGALGIRIGGNNIYFGRVVEKPTIGDPDRELEAEDISRTVKLMYVTSFLALMAGMVFSVILLAI
ncbi:MAG: adenosylcobinamide-phosphate synthase CbiB [Acetivibrionales bacterium]